MRKLATLQTITDIQPIPKADKIEVLSVLGWKIVAQKGVHNIGDKIVYFEVDSFLPVIPEFEFLRAWCYRENELVGEGFRIKTMCLRGQVSQGMVLPLSVVSNLTSLDLSNLSNGYDLTAELNVKQWEIPTVFDSRGVALVGTPSDLVTPDQTRIQSIFDDMKRNGAFDIGTYEMSLKLDGSAMRVFCINGKTGVCNKSRLLEKVPEYEFGMNSWIDTADTYKLVDIVKTMSSELGMNLEIQGELVGPGIQGNRDKHKNHMFYVYDIVDSDTRKKLPPLETYKLCLKYKLDHIPILKHEFDLSHITLDELLELADNPPNYDGETWNKIPEGIVLKCNVDTSKHFKVISNKYLLKCEE